jgi:hypothetical protein
MLKAIASFRNQEDFRIRLKRMSRCILMIMHITQQKLMVHQAVRELYPNQKSWPFFSLICLVEREIFAGQKFIGL